MSRYSRGEPNVVAWVQQADGYDRCELFVVERGTRQVRFMAADGSFGPTRDPYERGEPCLILPRATAGNVGQAFEEFMRPYSADPGTEAKVLREVLAVEQRRVDSILGRQA